MNSERLRAMVSGQRRFDDLGSPLSAVPFCVVDLETTGGSPATCAITEVGAVKLLGGRCIGTFQTLVNPGMAIPPEIVVLTGITESMVIPAPPIGEVLPAFLEFSAGTVIVGHNVRFDLGFLQAALAQTDRPRLDNRWVDTCALARRLVRDEVPDCRLSTLARHLRLGHQPCHRALDDALATGHLLHVLLERAAGLGVLGLDDLLELPTMGAHPQAGKLKLTTGLPRRPGVYLFKGLGGRVLYVGKATNLRARVRSYFSGDDRRKIGSLLRQAESIDHVECANPLEAAVLEVRLIHQHQPPFNRQAKLWKRYVYLKLTLDERFPRLSVVRVPSARDGCLYLGPLSSAAAARHLAEAIESAIPIRRCSAPIRRSSTLPLRDVCTAAQLGVSECPCAGTISEEDYAVIVDRLVRGLTTDPSLLLDPLDERMAALVAEERFEEAASTRDRAAALTRALTRQRRIDGLRRAGRIELLQDPGPGSPASGPRRTVLHSGRLVGDAGTLDLEGINQKGTDADRPLARHLLDELSCVAAWLDGDCGMTLDHCEGEWTSALPRLPTYVPARGSGVVSEPRQPPWTGAPVLRPGSLRAEPVDEPPGSASQEADSPAL